ncbi:MAG: c-type cytochrome [Candidatus Zixiibacteriota bacterium]
MSKMLSGRARATATGLILLAIAVFLAFCNDNQAATQTPVMRGEYLVTAGGCADCHSPKNMTDKGPVEDISRHLAGHPAEAGIPTVPDNVLSPDGWIAMTNIHSTAWAGPWGISFAPNITPDLKTGIGNWTVDEFINAMHNGKHQGYGRPILPPMPWAAIGKLTDEDLRAVFAYLQSIPPVNNKAPDWIIGPPPKS